MKKLLLTIGIVFAMLWGVWLVGCNTSTNENGNLTLPPEQDTSNSSSSDNKIPNNPDILPEEELSAPTIESISSTDRERIVFEMETRQQYKGYDAQISTAEAQIQAWYDEYARIPEYEAILSNARPLLAEQQRVCTIIGENLYDKPNQYGHREYKEYSSTEEMYAMLNTYLDLTEMPIRKGSYDYGNTWRYDFSTSYTWIKNEIKTTQEIINENEEKLNSAKDTSPLNEAQEYYNKCVCSCAWSAVMQELSSESPTNQTVLAILNEWKEKHIGDEEPTWYGEILRIIRIVGGVDLREE